MRGNNAGHDGGLLVRQIKFTFIMVLTHNQLLYRYYLKQKREFKFNLTFIAWKKERARALYSMKRKRGAKHASKGPFKKRRYFRPGYDRQVGYYGRFAGNKGELKFLDTSIADANIAGGWQLQTNPVLIAQGVTESQRVGRKCTLKSLNWRGTLVRAEGANSNLADITRICVVWDKQANGAAPTEDTIWNDGSDVNSFRNLVNSSRYQVLFDKVVTMGAAQGGTSGDGTTENVGSWNTQFNFYKECNIPMEFSSTTGAITEHRTNSIAVITRTRAGTAVVLASTFRVRFSDGS